MIKKLIALAEKGYIPDLMIRLGIRSLLQRRIKELVSEDKTINLKNKQSFINDMDAAPLALVPDLANEQHYEIPAEFYNLCYEYLNDCLKAGIVYRREFYNDSELEAENTLMFKITLTPFGNINSPTINR